MPRNNSERRISFCLIVLSAAIGLLVHPFYDWTGADQSRPVALLWQIPLAISFALGLFCMALPWISIERSVESNRLLKKGTGTSQISRKTGTFLQGLGASPLSQQAGTRRPFQFSLRILLSATGAIALLLGTGIRYPKVFTGLVFLFGVLMIVYCWRRFPSERWSISALLAAMYLPFGWIVFHLKVSMLLRCIWFTTSPTFLPAFFVVRNLQLNGLDYAQIAIGMALTFLELAVGLFLIHLGPKRGMVYAAMALIVSLFGAVGLDALIRM